MPLETAPHPFPNPPHPTGAREEAEAVIYGAVQEVLDKTGVKPKEVDILIINCSLFSPTPSLCAMVVHHFGMRSDTLTYNLR